VLYTGQSNRPFYC